MFFWNNGDASWSRAADIVHAIVMRMSSVKTVLWLAVNLHQLCLIHRAVVHWQATHFALRIADALHAIYGAACAVSSVLWCTGLLSYRTHEAGVVPGESQRLQELIARFDGEVTSVTAGAEQGVVI